jgi:hypothetical protein
MLTWIHRGEFVGFHHLTPDEVEIAERGGWGEFAEGKSADFLTRANREPHPEADEFMKRRSKQLYGTRELRAAPLGSRLSDPLAQAASIAPTPSTPPTEETQEPQQELSRRRRK